MKTEVTFYLPLRTSDPNEIKTLTLALENIPRVGDSIAIDGRLAGGERVERFCRVSEVSRKIKFNVDAGYVDEYVSIFTQAL